MVHKDGFQAWKLKKLSLNVWREKEKEKEKRERKVLGSNFGIVDSLPYEVRNVI